MLPSTFKLVSFLLVGLRMHTHRRRGLATIALVIGLLVIGGILGAAYFLTSTSLAREEHRALLGQQAQLVARNLVDEAYYSTFVRVNSPRESARFEPNLYDRVRVLKEGGSLTYTIQPILTLPTLKGARFDVEPVTALVVLSRFQDVPTIQNVPQAAPVGGPTTNPSAAASPSGIPAGTPGQICYTIDWKPKVVWQRVGYGEMQFTAKVSAHGALGYVVSRDLTATYPFQLVIVSQDPPLTLVNMIPVQSNQALARDFKQEKRDAKAAP